MVIGCSQPEEKIESPAQLTSYPEEETSETPLTETTEEELTKEDWGVTLSHKLAEQDLSDHQELVVFYRSAKQVIKEDQEKLAKEKAERDVDELKTHEEPPSAEGPSSGSSSSSSDTGGGSTDQPNPEPEPQPDPTPDPEPPFEPYYSASIGSHGLFNSEADAWAEGERIEDEWFNLREQGIDPGWSWSGWETYPVRHYYAPGESKLYYTVNFY